MPVSELGEHPADLAGLRRVTAAQGASERLTLRGYALHLAKRLAYQAPGPQRQPAGQRRIRYDRLAHPGYHEIGVTRIRQHLVHESLRLRIDEVRDRAVEISRKAVTHVGLDKSLEPVGGAGAGKGRPEAPHQPLHGVAQAPRRLLQPPRPA